MRFHFRQPFVTIRRQRVRYARHCSVSSAFFLPDEGTFPPVVKIDVSPLTARTRGRTMLDMEVRARLNERIDQAMKASGTSLESLAKKFDVTTRTLQSRFAGATDWTLPQLAVLADLFFNGNFGSMLNPAAPVQNELREAIAEEVDRAVARALAHAVPITKGAPTLHRKRAAG